MRIPLPFLPLALVFAAACAGPERYGEPLEAGQDLWAVLDTGFDTTKPDPATMPEHADPDAVERSGQYRLDLILLRGPFDADSPFERPEQWRQVAAPCVLMMEGQAASVMLVSETAYVADFQVVENERAMVADPTVGTLRTGMVVDAIVEEGEGRVFRCRARIHRSELAQMVEQESRLAGYGANITTQLPAVAQAESEIQFDADRGVVRLYQLPLLAGDDEVELLALRVYPVEEDAPHDQVRRQRLSPRTSPSQPWPTD